MSASITYKNTPVSYQKSGHGPCIILLHGFMESVEIWNGFVAELEKEFSVLNIDLPGHGRSGLSVEVNSIPGMTDVVMAVADYEKQDQFVVCGHSLGGYVALDLASRYPGKVKGVALFHSHGAPDDEQAKENRRRMINIVKLNHTGFIRQFISDLFAEENKERLAAEIDILGNRATSTSAKSIVATLEGMRERAGSLEFLIETELPVMFVVGRNDSRMPYQKIMAQAMLCRNVQVQLLDHVGHMGFMETPAKIFPVLRDFFRRCLNPA